jgi:hypothetical protein
MNAGPTKTPSSAARAPVGALPATPADETDEGARAALTTRIVITLTVIVGQLWALTVGLEAYLEGQVGQAWLLAGFSAVSFLIVLVLVRLELPSPSRRPSREH